MKVLLLALFSSPFMYSFSQAPPIADSVAKKFNISRVTRIFKYPFRQSTSYIDYYDKTGKLIKSEKIDEYNKEKTLTSYKYHNGLLINVVFKSYYKGKVYDVQNTVNTYSKGNRLTSSTTVIDKDGITKDTVIYNEAMNSETIHSYANDTSIYNPERRGYDVRRTKNLHERQVTISYYDPAKNKLKQIDYSYDTREGCMLSHRATGVTDSTGYRITEFYNMGDTAIQKITVWQCGTQKDVSLYKSVKVSETETYSYNTFNGYRGDTARIFDKFNKLHLISTRNINTIQNGYKDPQLTVVTYRYFYYIKR